MCKKNAKKLHFSLAKANEHAYKHAIAFSNKGYFIILRLTT